MTGGPHFVGIGAHKAATSWLFKMLSMHPDVYFPRGKEVNFWNASFDKRAHVQSYLGGFREGVAAALGGLSGDITPLYMLIPRSDIEVFHQTLPETKLLFIARNPVERAISGTDFYLKYHPDEAGNYRGLLFSNFMTNCGLYMKYLDNWLEFYPRDRLHVIVQDDILTDPRAVMTGVGAHLGLDPAIWLEIPEKFLRQRSNAATAKTEVSEADRTRLRDIYRADVERLSRFLDRDLTSWVA